MKYVVFLLIFIFSPLAFNANGLFGRTEIVKPNELAKVEPIPKTVEEKLIEAFSDWKIAEASYYDPKDSTQTKEHSDGVGTLERMIESGSIALGAFFTETIKKEKMEVYIEVANLKVITPYGKGIFRVDDIMPGKYTNKNHIHIDFFQDDLSLKYKRMGRFKIKFKIVKILNGT